MVTSGEARGSRSQRAFARDGLGAGIVGGEAPNWLMSRNAAEPPNREHDVQHHVQRVAVRSPAEVRHAPSDCDADADVGNCLCADRAATDALADNTDSDVTHNNSRT